MNPLFRKTPEGWVWAYSGTPLQKWELRYFGLEADPAQPEPPPLPGPEKPPGLWANLRRIIRPRGVE